MTRFEMNVKNIENLNFYELINLSKNYHINLIKDPDYYRFYNKMVKIHELMLTKTDSEEWVISVLNDFLIEIEGDAYLIFINQYKMLRNVIISKKKKSLILIFFEEAIFSQLQYLIFISNPNEKEKQYLIIFLEGILKEHFNLLEKNEGNIFFLMILERDKNNLLFKNFCIKLKKMYFID